MVKRTELRRKSPLQKKRKAAPGSVRMKRCERCGADFYDSQSGLAQRFCSMECSGADQRDQAIAGYPPREEVVRLYCEEGLSDRALGERFGHTYQWSLGVRRAYGITADMKPTRRGRKITARPAVPRVQSNGYVKIGDEWEHRVVMEDKIGRPLANGEVVHHIDKDTTNNSPDNLILYPSHSEHMWDERGRYARKPRSAPKKRVARRDWTEARQKVEAEGKCRVCARSDIRLEAAHIIPRSRVSIGTGGEHPDNIVPLCAEMCHPQFDTHELDLLPFLTLGEQSYAVTLCGGLVEALQRVTGERWAPLEHAA